MGIVTRTTKPISGTTDYATNDSVTAANLNGDLNAIVNQFNGNVENVNIAAAAAIAWTKLDTAGQVVNASVSAIALIDPEKIDDQADNEFIFQGIDDPGETGASVLPVSLQDEIQILRFVARAGLLGKTAMRTSGFNAAWYDGAARGGNLLFNGSFLVWNSSTPTVGDGWVASGGAATTVALTALGAGDETEGAGSCLRIVDGTGGRGIEQSLSGLKASTKYLVSCRVRPAPGLDRCQLSTTGAVAGSFANLAINSASGSGSWETLSGPIRTDAAGTPIVVRLRGVAAASDWKCTHFRLQPAEVDPIGIPASIVDFDTSADDGNAGPLTISSLDVAVKIPSSGCVLVVLGKVSARSNGGTGNASVSLRQNDGVVAEFTADRADTGFTGANGFTRAHMVVFTVIAQPVPGRTYTFDCDFTGGGTVAGLTDGATIPHLLVAILMRL